MKHYIIQGQDAGTAAAAPDILQDPRIMSTQSRRPFRRRAALEAGAGAARPQTGPGWAEPGQGGAGPAAEPTRNLPATLPDSWARLRREPIGVRRHILARAPLVSFFRDDPAARAFDHLRTRLYHAIKAHGWRRVAVAAPSAGCGATFTAVNLALSLARVPGSRTVLMDLNQRAPGVARMLDMPGLGDTRRFLKGEIPAEAHLVKPCDNLALGLTAAPDPRAAAELLHAPSAADALDMMTETLNPDLVLFDLPAVLEHDDFTAFLPRVDCVLLVADGTRTTARQIAACEELIDGHAPLLGVVLNRARRAGVDSGGA